MAHVNIEIKARCRAPRRIRAVLSKHGARFVGVDNQTDTYFKVPQGRLKLREGNVENALIFYNRPNKSGPKQADVCLYRCQPSSGLKDVLAGALEVLTVVRKKREIYFIGNVKFHIDKVDGLGGFVEIEAIDKTGIIGKKKLLIQCRRFMKLFGIRKTDLVDRSYSDMVATKQHRQPG